MWIWSYMFKHCNWQNPPKFVTENLFKFMFLMYLVLAYASLSPRTSTAPITNIMSFSSYLLPYSPTALLQTSLISMPTMPLQLRHSSGKLILVGYSIVNIMKDIHKVFSFTNLLVRNYDISVKQWTVTFGNIKAKSCSYIVGFHHLMLISFQTDRANRNLTWYQHNGPPMVVTQPSQLNRLASFNISCADVPKLNRQWDPWSEIFCWWQQNTYLYNSWG